MTCGVQPGGWCRHGLPPNDLWAPECTQGLPQLAASNGTFLAASNGTFLLRVPALQGCSGWVVKALQVGWA